MPYDSGKHHRRSIRLKDYDYSQGGAYFVTCLTHDRQNLFGAVANGEMQLNELGNIAEQAWLEIPRHHPHAALDEFVVMPNHIHGIMIITDHTGRGVQLNAPTPRTPNAPTTNNTPTRHADPHFSTISPFRHTLGVIIRTYKAAVTTACRVRERHDFAWQRNYHEHIIRSERDLEHIRAYILGNPARWMMDLENPEKKK